MAGRRRGARSGRGWDALPPRAAAPKKQRTSAEQPAPPPRDPGEVARDTCLQLLAVRPRTRAELATALRRRGIAEEVAADVLDRYDEVGLIDDAAFARAWVSSRHHGKGLARRALAGELRRRGVDAETVEQAVQEELDGETEAQTARVLVDRKLRATSSGDPEALLRKLVGMLARKGYPPGLAFRVVKDALAADERTAELADQVDADALAEASIEPDPGER
ncbi:MAG TPA: regulatory protein RecX [Micromonosporaceae bacterium]|nr:regulatory protein RecX [Micromonosporaceae bacterium]